MANRKDHEQWIVKAARKIAESGHHHNWHDVACELRLQGEPLSLNVLERQPYRAELDKICAEVWRRKQGSRPSNPLPGWKMFATEMSPAHWRIECVHADGRSVSRDGTDLAALQRQVIEDASTLPERRHAKRS